MSKIKTTSKVSLKLSSRINLGRREGKARVRRALDLGHSPQVPRPRAKTPQQYAPPQVIANQQRVTATSKSSFSEVVFNKMLCKFKQDLDKHLQKNLSICKVTTQKLYWESTLVQINSFTRISQKFEITAFSEVHTLSIIILAHFNRNNPLYNNIQQHFFSISGCVLRHITSSFSSKPFKEGMTKSLNLLWQ